MYDFRLNYPDCDVSPEGIVYVNGQEYKPFNSNGYKQVLLPDKDGVRKVLGVHVVVAMKYSADYFEGCTVHHKDHNKQNNHIDNLEIYSRSEHARLHAIGNTNLADYTRIHGPHNKGKKMSSEFCKKCSESAKKRGFVGNQFIDKYGNQRKK